MVHNLCVVVAVAATLFSPTAAFSFVERFDTTRRSQIARLKLGGVAPPFGIFQGNCDFCNNYEFATRYVKESENVTLEYGIGHKRKIPYTKVETSSSRRKALTSISSLMGGAFLLFVPFGWKAGADDGLLAGTPDVVVVPTGDVKKLFNEGRALEAQGNILAAQRLYSKVTKISPRFVYGWSSLGNTLVAQGDLNAADENYSKAIALCEESLNKTEASFGNRRCDDLYLLLLNRGSVRLNNGMPQEALADLQKSDYLRARPDAILLQNLARAQEINCQYSLSDKSYNTAISMTSNEVSPFWIRASMVKYQLGDLSGAMDLMKRVENRFPEAPEVRAAYAVMLWGKGDEDAARKKFLEIPDRQRRNYVNKEYLDKVIFWPPVMKDGLAVVTRAVGDL